MSPTSVAEKRGETGEKGNKRNKRKLPVLTDTETIRIIIRRDMRIIIRTFELEKRTAEG